MRLIMFLAPVEISAQEVQSKNLKKMKQAYCQRDIFHAPSDGEIICKGVVQQDVPVGTLCSITCNAAIADPREINCLPSGWDAGLSS